MAWYDPISAIIALVSKKPTATQWYAALQAIANLDLSHLARADVTTNNADTTAHGLLPKLTGTTTHWLRADGSYTPVAITEAW